LSRLKAHIQELEHSLSVVERQKQELEEKKVDAEFDRAKIASKYKKLRASLEKLETGQQQSIAAEQSISASLEKAKESKRSHPVIYH
jgi:chromosome segregation ATPase